MLILSAAAGPVQAQSLRVTGATGYLSEWEVSGSVTETVSGRVRELSGPSSRLLSRMRSRVSLSASA